MPQVEMCPRCGAARGASLRWCPTCGLDYWELASQEAPLGAVPQPAPVPVRRTEGISSVLVTVGGILGVLAVCGLVLLVFLKIPMAPWSSASGSEPPSSLGGVQFPDVLASGIPFTGDATRVVDGFMAEVHRSDATFHVQTTATVEALSGPGGLRLTAGTFTDDMDVAGTSFAGITSATGPSSEDNFKADIVYIDGDVWIRWLGDDRWTSGTFEQPFPVNPLRSLSRQDVQYIGSETRDGQVVHHLQTRRWLGADPDSVAGHYDVDLSDQVSVTDIYVTDAGIPISMHSEMTMNVGESWEQIRLEITVDSTYSAWATPITIAPPG